jgi:4'-phosphopantetheinyl transferase
VERISRQVLATYLETAPEALEFERGEGGKPRLRDAGDVEFNLSHSGELVVVAVTRGRAVGVDVERIAPERDRPPAFYEEWVRREAALKCLGVGLLADPPAEPVAVASFDAAPGYAAAVAVAGSAVGEIRRRALPA